MKFGGLELLDLTRLQWLLALGDNIEFFFKYNTGLEPDTLAYKETSL